MEKKYKMAIRHSGVGIVPSLVLVLLGLTAAVPGAAAQSYDDFAKQAKEQFEAFRQEKQQEFEAFTARQNEEFAAFVEQQWQLFEDFKVQTLAMTVPKLSDAPVVPGTEPPAAPIDSEQTTYPPVQAGAVAGSSDAYAVRTAVSAAGTKELPAPQSQPSQGRVTGNAVTVSFYGQPVTLPFSSKLNIHTAGTREADCAAYFRNIAQCNAETHALWQALAKQATAFGLNEWGHYRLVRAVAEAAFKDVNDRVLFCFCLLRNEGGYKVKLARGRDSGNLTLLLAIDNSKEVYSYSFFRFDEAGKQVKYYAVYGGGKAKESIYSYSFQEQDNRLREIGLDFAQALNIGKCDKSRTVQFRKQNANVQLPYSSAHLAYLNDVPMTVFPIYFASPVPTETQKVLQERFGKLKQQCTQVELVAALLDFVQTAFAYKTDEDQFGYEKYFYPEEVIGYPYSDCEDRAALFSWLVGTYAGARVIGLQYEGHIATAVSFDEDPALKGDSFSYGGRKYYMCDPTYINASIGMTMPSYKGKTPKIIKLNTKR